MSKTETPETVASTETIPATPATGEQTADTPGNDENGDGLKGGQATADNHGDILGI